MHIQPQIPLRTAPHDGADVVEELRATVAVVVEYIREHERAGLSREQRLLERVRSLLAGGMVGSEELDYELDSLHLGVIAHGPGAAALVEDLAEGCKRKLLLVPTGDQAVWGWLGGQRRVAAEGIERVLAAGGGRGEVWLAVGEPGRGVDGWRDTHRQAQTALSLALCRPPGLTRFADVALLAPLVENRALGGWLLAANNQQDQEVIAREANREALERAEAERRIRETEAAEQAAGPQYVLGGSEGWACEYAAETGQEGEGCGGGDGGGGDSRFRNNEDPGLPAGAQCEGNIDSKRYKKEHPGLCHEIESNPWEPVDAFCESVGSIPVSPTAPECWGWLTGRAVGRGIHGG